MMIINTSNYTKPYMVMYVGYAKFIIQPKLNMLIILYLSNCIIYNSGELLGQIVYNNLLTENVDVIGYDGCDTEWDDNTVCGYQVFSPHNIPFYNIDIFGYKVMQYMCDRPHIANTSTITLRGNLLQI